tara:strand:+ start:384 stop:884 length:501 start_codon:yes stop_codon:yes gene_type:complete
MESYQKEQLLTTTIQVDSSDIYKTKSIDGLLKYKLKEDMENICGKYGYVIKDSLTILKRSIGKCTIHNNKSKIQYDLTIKIKVILPCISDIYECMIDSITKAGIIAHMNIDDINLNNSPILFIIPQEYITDDIESYNKSQVIKVEVLQKRIKYRTKQIQIVGKIVK